MSEKVTIETHTTKSEFRSTGGYESAVKDFLVKHPDNSTGTVTIRKDKRVWFKSGDEIVIGKSTKETGTLSYEYPVCPVCEAGLDKTATRTLCVSCASMVKITKRGNQYITEVIKT